MRGPFVLVLLTLSLACGKIADEGAEGGTGAERAPAPAPPSPSPEPATRPTRSGVVFLYSMEDGFGALPSFPVTPPPSSSVIDLRMGSCMRDGWDVEPPPPARPDADAGDVIVTTVPADLSLTVPYDARVRHYTSVANPGRLLPGAPIAVHGSGGAGVPAFDATIASVAPLEVTAPLAGETIHPDTTDLVVRWSTTEALPIYVTLSGRAADKHVFCMFDPQERQGVIPKELVKEATTPPAGQTCTRDCVVLTVRRDRSTQVVAGAYDIDVRHATWFDRSLVLGD
jgi:hypothetical protein